MRKRLFEMGKGQDAEKAAGAIRALKFLKELGVLMALRDEKSAAGKLADLAAFELMNPKVVTGVKMPEKPAGN